MSRSSGIAVRARRFTIMAAFVSLAVAFGIFYFAWQSYVVDVRTDQLVRQVSALGRGLEAGSAAETTEAEPQEGEFNDRAHTHRGDDGFTGLVSNLLKNTRLSSASVRSLCWTL